MKVSARYPEKNKRASDRRRSPDRSRPSEGSADRGRLNSNDDYKRGSRRGSSPERSRRQDHRRMERSISPRRSPLRSSFQRNFRSKSPNVDLRSRISERLYEHEKFPPTFTDRIEPVYPSSSAYNERMGLRFSPPMVVSTPLVMDHHLPQTFEPLQHFNAYAESEPPVPMTQWNRNETLTHDREPIVEWNYNNHRDQFESNPKGNWEDPEKARETYTEVPNVLQFLSPDENHPDIPIFDGKNPDLTSRQWIRIIDEVGFKENWTSEKKKFQMASKLIGAPKEWFIREDKLTHQWKKIKLAFIKAFIGDMDYATCLQRMMSRFKLDTESYGNYFTYKTMLLNACNITGRKAVSCIISGLSDELKLQCLDQNFATSELLYAYLVQHEQIKKNTAKSESATQARSCKYCLCCKQYQPVNHQCTQKPSSFSIHNKQESVHLSLFIDVIINGYTLQGYNDLKSDVVTIREDQALVTKLHYNKYNKNILGHRGVVIEALGNINVLLRVGSAVVNMQVFIVPNMSQDYPVVIGESLRNHPEVNYFEDITGSHFVQKSYQPSENTSFSMNEKLVMKMNDSRDPVSSLKISNRKIKDRLSQRQKTESSGYTSRFEQPSNPRIKYSKFR